MSRRFNDRTPIDIDKEIGKVKEMAVPELVNYIISTMERKRISSFEALRNDAFISPLGYVTELPNATALMTLYDALLECFNEIDIEMDEDVADVPWPF